MSTVVLARNSSRDSFVSYAQPPQKMLALRDVSVLLLRQMERRIGLSAATAALNYPRSPARIKHELRDLVAQRLYGLCCG